jgi:tetratricopeptide (TPR) repeat protein
MTAAALLVVLCPSQIGAQTRQEGDWCQMKGNPSPEQIIAGCDAIIRSSAYVTLGDVYYNRRLALSKLRRYLDALDSYDHAIAINPGDSNAYLARGNA